MKTDITYNTQKHGNSYQSTISLACLGGVAFVGELVATTKLAESAAANQVLKHYAAEIAQLNAMPKEKKSNKRPASAMSGDGTGILQPAEKAQKVDEGPIPPKKEVNEICMKIVRRMLQKDEIKYASQAVAGGFQATLRLSCLPGVYGENQFTGTVCSNKKEAELSVATIAVQTLKADTEFAEIINKPKEKKEKGKGKGKTKGKGKGKGDGEQGGGGGGEGGWDMGFGGMDMDPMMSMMSMMMGFGGGWGGGGMGTGSKKSDGKRERVSTTKVTGTIEDWKENFGWIKPSAPIQHDKASKHGGKIYLNKKDAPAGKELKAGTSISFHVYADNSGLGAEDCE